ncbi:MAG: CapA family protein [Nannocystaceae bacterium]|nr:CapA family protein [Nannocystaceae bacterium]
MRARAASLAHGLWLLTASAWACARGPEPAIPAAAAGATPPTAAPASPAAAPATPAATEPTGPAAAAPSQPPRKAIAPLPEGYLAFDGACDGGTTVTIAAIGDVLLHHELQKQAYASKQRFGVLWQSVADLLGKADLTYANLEVPIAAGLTKDGPATDPGLSFDNAVYTGYPFFNANPALAKDLAAAGVDIVSTANNHALDRGSDGLERTLDALDAAKIAHAGTRRTAKDPWHAITEAGGLRIAWLACTLHTNFGKDDKGQVLHCFKQTKQVLAEIEALAGRDDVDAVIVTPHWGKEYDPVPSDKQRVLAQQMVDAGATAVLGAHPHVLQPWERLRAADGRDAFVIYSLGNFVHHQRSLPRRASMVLYLGLRRRDDGTVVPAGARYVPIDVRMEGDKQAFFVEATDRSPGHDDARQLVVDMFGAANLLAPDAPVVVAPQCDPAWTPGR